MSGEQPQHDDQPAHVPLVTLPGTRVALGPFSRAVLPHFAAWENDLEITRLSGDPARPTSLEAVTAEFERLQATSRSDEVAFVIYERTTWRPIGTTGLRNLNAWHRTAEFGITIGEKDCWGKGYGTEATRLVLDYAFHELGLHNVLLTVFSYNQRALHVYQRVGFREIGRRREAQRVGPHAYDVLYMDCLATEFQRGADGGEAGN